MGLLSNVIFYKLGKRSANKRNRRQTMRADFSNLDPDGAEYSDSVDAYDDAMAARAEEEILLQQEKSRKNHPTNRSPEFSSRVEASDPESPWGKFLTSLDKSNKATIDYANKLQPKGDAE